MSHPVPFMKASGVAAPTAVSRTMPDLEEAIEEEAEPEVAEAPDVIDDELDLKNDKYIKKPKAKPAQKSKKSRSDEDEDEDENDEPKAKKGRGRPKSTGAKGKGKK